MRDGLALLLLGACLTSNDDSEEHMTRAGVLQVIQHRIGVSETLEQHDTTDFFASYSPPLALQTDDYLSRLERFTKCEELNEATKVTTIEAAEEDAWFTWEVAKTLESLATSVKVRV